MELEGGELLLEEKGGVTGLATDVTHRHGFLGVLVLNWNEGERERSERGFCVVALIFESVSQALIFMTIRGV